jgi:deazaflavin-dependent oxidoreductase (nitroreductase family)
MDDRIRRALSRGHLIDITTTGRRSGIDRRLEIVFHNFDGRIFISGMPSRRTRDWIANLEANPRMTVHLKGAVTADLPATARLITDPAERREVLIRVAQVWRRQDVDIMVAYSPLIEVSIDGFSSPVAA